MLETEQTSAPIEGRAPQGLDPLGGAGRANVYQYLAGAYLRPPSQALLDSALDPGLWEGLDALLGEQAFVKLRAFRTDPRELEQVRQSYMDLFRVPAGSYVTPFESVYRDQYVRSDGKVRKRLMGPSASHAASFYEAAGCTMEHPEECGNMPDYIGAELDFMRYLCAQEEAGMTAGELDQVGELITLQRRFLDEHLIGWIGELELAVASSDAVGFYAGLTHLAHFFVRWDSARLELPAG